jgi:HAD superfamily hydrolase (TIGR01509 family)
MTEERHLCAGVIFDLDGTLVDSNYLHTLAWASALRAAGFWRPMNAIHRLIGMGSDQLLPRLIGHEDDQISEHRDQIYATMKDQVVAFPAAEVLLRAIRRMGLSVVLATSSSPDDYAPMVDLLGGPELVDAHTTIDDVARSKPDAEIFERAIAAGHLDATRSIVVGDSRWDVEAASSAGLACLAVESGGTSRDELLSAGALGVYRDVEQLHAFLAVSPIALLVAGAAAA